MNPIGYCEEREERKWYLWLNKFRKVEFKKKKKLNREGIKGAYFSNLFGHRTLLFEVFQEIVVLSIQLWKSCIFGKE